MISETIDIEVDTNVISSKLALREDVNCSNELNLIPPSTFWISVGITPIPFLIIFSILANDELRFPTSLILPDSNPIICGSDVTLIKSPILSIKVGIELVPFDTIVVTISNDELIVFRNAVVTSIDDVYCDSVLFLTKPLTFVIVVGKLYTPFNNISIVVANDELTDNDSEIEAVYIDWIWAVSVTLILSTLFVITSKSPNDGISIYRCVSEIGNSSTMLIIPLASISLPFT